MSSGYQNYERGKYRELGQENSRPSKLIVGLPYTLTEEMPKARRIALYEKAARDCLRSAGRTDGPHHLEVLEQHVAVVSIRRQQSGAADAESSRPICVKRAIEKNAAGVPESMQWKRPEKILRAN